MSPIGIVIFDFDDLVDFDALVVRASWVLTLILDDLVRFGDDYANLLSLRAFVMPSFQQTMQ